MYNIIGLGLNGCNVAEKFEGKENYNVKLIDSDIEGDNNCICVQTFNSHEEYEKNFPNLSSELSDIKENVLLILDGSNDISGGSLKLLKQLSNCKIKVLYLKPDPDILGVTAKLQERLTFNVLQQYARSGVFEEIYLTSNLELEKIIGNIPIINFNDSLNELIFNCYSSVNLFNEMHGIIDTSIKKENFWRINTLGVYDLENNIEKLFYRLDYIDRKLYYISVPKERLTNDQTLLKIIRDNMKEKNNDQTKIGYKILSHENSDRIYSYILANSRKVQE